MDSSWDESSSMVSEFLGDRGLMGLSVRNGSRSSIKLSHSPFWRKKKPLYFRTNCRLNIDNAGFKKLLDVNEHFHFISTCFKKFLMIFKDMLLSISMKLRINGW